MNGFISKFKLFFEKLFGAAPAWIHVAQAVVSFAAPVATAVITGFAPELLPIAAPIMAEVQADLATVAVLTADGTATTSLASAIGRIQANLSALLAAGHIKDAKLQSEVTLVVSELAALAAMLPGTVPAPSTMAIGSTAAITTA